MRTLFLTAFLAHLPLSCPATEDVLIYDEDSLVAGELRIASPDKEWEIVYTGNRHRKAPTLQRVATVALVHRSGRQYLLEEMRKSTSQVVLSPWSPDGKWLAVQSGKRVFHFYPVEHLPQALLSGGLCFEVSHNNTRLFCEQGAWAENGTFTFHAGLSGDYAPYRAGISADKVEVQRVGEFRKLYPRPCSK